MKIWAHFRPNMFIHPTTDHLQKAVHQVQFLHSYILLINAYFAEPPIPLDVPATFLWQLAKDVISDKRSMIVVMIPSTPDLSEYDWEVHAVLLVILFTVY
jgi:hypothetical protein